MQFFKIKLFNLRFVLCLLVEKEASKFFFILNLSFQIIHRSAKTRPEQQRRSQAEKLSISDVGVTQRRINVNSKRSGRFRGGPLFRRQRSSLRRWKSFGWRTQSEVRLIFDIPRVGPNGKGLSTKLYLNSLGRGVTSQPMAVFPS